MGTKTVPAKPSELIILAINNLEEKDGSSPHEIIKFISQEFKMKAEEVTPRVHEALKRAITYGILSQKGGKYKMQDVPKQSGLEEKPSAAKGVEPPGTSKPDAERPKPGNPKPRKRAPVKRAARKKKAPAKPARDGRVRRGPKKVCKRCQSRIKYSENQ